MLAKQSVYMQVTFRLERQLVERLRAAAAKKSWPPGPQQVDIVTRGIELVLEELARNGADKPR